MTFALEIALCIFAMSIPIAMAFAMFFKRGE